MKLFITTSSLDIIACNIDPYDTIGEIKKQINSRHPEWPLSCLKLVCEDILLNDNAKVEDYNLKDGNSTIRLVIKAIPCKYRIDPQLERWYVNNNKRN